MTRTENFTLRITPSDRAIFEELAKRLNQSQSAALRMIAREVVFALRAKDSPALVDTLPTQVNEIKE